MGKKNQGELVLVFALKVVGPLVIVLVTALGVDVSRMIDRMDSAPVGRGSEASGSVSGLSEEIEYQWYMLF